MVRQTHDLVNDHFGELNDAQIATGTPTTGQAPLSNGDGTRTWGTVSGGGLSDLITGNDSTFAASLGSWTASGGTITRDTGTHTASNVASLKHVTSSTNQHIDLPIAGTFEADKQYLAILLVQPSGDATFTPQLGLIGTDSASGSGALTATSIGSNFLAIGIAWTPSADRTGVTLRLTCSDTGVTYYVGWVKAFQSPVPVMLLDPDSQSWYLPVFLDAGYTGVQFGPQGTGLIAKADGAIYYDNASGNAGYDANSDNTIYAYAEGSGAANLSESGINFETGPDWVGFYVTEKDASTIQIYDDAGGAYDIEFVDQSTFHFRSVDASAVVRDFSSMESRKGSGSATILDTTTSIAVTHGAGYTPDASDITVTPTNNPTNDPGNFWISSVGATTFTINVRADPGASGATFAWRVDR